MATSLNVARTSPLSYLAIVLLFHSLTPSAAIALDQPELDLNRALWNSFNISNYDFILGRSCFCDPVTIRPGLVMVRMDAIAAVVDAVTHEPRNPQDFFTIDASFDLLQQSLNTPDIVVTAEFDLQFGYPREFGFDIPQLADDEIIYEISALRIVPEPATSALNVVALVTLGTLRRSHRRITRQTI
jgi:hypothetical protein